jgi:hypothetical protein
VLLDEVLHLADLGGAVLVRVGDGQQFQVRVLLDEVRELQVELRPVRLGVVGLRVADDELAAGAADELGAFCAQALSAAAPISAVVATSRQRRASRVMDMVVPPARSIILPPWKAVSL